VLQSQSRHCDGNLHTSSGYKEQRCGPAGYGHAVLSRVSGTARRALVLLFGVPCAEHELEHCASVAPSLGGGRSHGDQRGDADGACVRQSGIACALGGGVDQMCEDAHG